MTKKQLEQEIKRLKKENMLLIKNIEKILEISNEHCEKSSKLIEKSMEDNKEITKKVIEDFITFSHPHSYMFNH